jgi:2-polyprenyl-3-methyl-5-hydroxy-6-metoxy-1,4-benzoquinol methylase
MESTQHNCPLCNSNQSELVLGSKDYSLTHTPFNILACSKCNFHFTDPIPSKDEIGAYYDFPDYISHTDVKEGWMNRIYHRVRSHTLIQKTNWVQSLFTGHKGNILEIGAGTGAFANAMQLKGWNVTALEPDPTSRQKALENYSIKLLPSEQLFDLPAQNFDVITLWHVLEHVHDLKGYLEAFSKLLKRNGRIIIAVPNYTSFDAQYYKSYWAAYDVPRHLYHFSPESMQLLCKRNNLQIIQYKPMWFDSFYVSLLSEKYKSSGFMGVISAFVIGGISNLLAWRNPQKASSVIYEIRKVE